MGSIQYSISKKGSEERGFTILEMLIAISIFMYGLLAITSMQAASIRGNASAGTLTTGTAWATAKMEQLKGLSYSDSNLTNGSHTDPSPPSGYTITWNVTDNFPLNDTKMLTITVAWMDRQVPKNATIQGVIPRII